MCPTNPANTVNAKATRDHASQARAKSAGVEVEQMQTQTRVTHRTSHSWPVRLPPDRLRFLSDLAKAQALEGTTQQPTLATRLNVQRCRIQMGVPHAQ